MLCFHFVYNTPFVTIMLVSPAPPWNAPVSYHTS